jgi:hypothetical protein
MSFISIAGHLPTLLAYLDPGSGSLLLQVMIAGLLSSMFFLKSSVVVVRSSLGRLFKKHA